ncbi:ABC-2 family transporter protein [Candidatus Parcubacteria bacterium]|nr:ABC-2 family transporter protein [Candidatus Parcubacteria bacterium]
MVFKKILAIIKIEIQRQMTYRADFLFFRLANILEIVVLIIIWTVVFKTNEIIAGYTYKEMMTYITVGWLMLYLTANYGLEHVISRHIYEGTLSSFLVKPIDYIKYIIIYCSGRITVAFASGILTAIALIIIMIENIIMINSLLDLLIIFVMLVFGYFINIFISILIGMLAFWTTFINGPRYSIRILISFLSGRFFPLNMLPIFYYKMILFFPFVYIYFIPLQLYLGKISTVQGLKALGVEIIWLALLYGLIRILWKRGLIKYEGVGM